MILPADVYLDANSWSTTLTTTGVMNVAFSGVRTFHLATKKRHILHAIWGLSGKLGVPQRQWGDDLGIMKWNPIFQWDPPKMI